MIEPKVFHIESDDQHLKLLSFIRARVPPYQIGTCAWAQR